MISANKGVIHRWQYNLSRPLTEWMLLQEVPPNKSEQSATVYNKQLAEASMKFHS